MNGGPKGPPFLFGEPAHVQHDEAIARIAQFPYDDPGAALGAGLALINGDHAEPLLPCARRLTERHPASAQAHQLLGLAARACADSAAAYAAFTAATRLAPGDALIAHSRARTALEAGLPAADLFAAAAPLAPQDGNILLGQAAALFAQGDAEAAVALLTRLLAANPLWLDGHRSLAALAGQIGDDPFASVMAALTRHSRSPDLHHLAISIALQARDLPRAASACQAAHTVLGPQGWLTLLTAHVASEHGDMDAADHQFAAAGLPTDANAGWMHARHFIRQDQPARAVAVIEPLLGQAENRALWPYLSLAWRMLGDPRAAWLEADPSLVGVYDLGYSPSELRAVADHVRTLHQARAAPLDQSVRGGTQTDGNLLLRAEATIRELRSRLLALTERHVSQLSKPVPGHPTLLARRAPLRISGSWSVRLQNAGFHADHVHPQGWFSSALYLALPETLGAGADDHAGWLALGEARDLAPGLAPYQLIEPKPGRLVLFPSTMWHGTRPFPHGERLTVAFDVARPRQD